MITDKELSDESNTADWLAYGRTHSEQRFSPLKDINVDNVGKLKPEWYLDLPDKWWVRRWLLMASCTT